MDAANVMLWKSGSVISNFILYFLFLSVPHQGILSLIYLALHVSLSFKLLGVF